MPRRATRRVLGAYDAVTRVAVAARASHAKSVDELILAELDPTGALYANKVMLLIDLAASGATASQHRIELMSRKTWKSFKRLVIAKDGGFEVEVDDFRTVLYRWSELIARGHAKGSVKVLHGTKDAARIAVIASTAAKTHPSMVLDALDRAESDDVDDDARPVPPAKRVAK